jgi:hypothetical protein
MGYNTSFDSSLCGFIIPDEFCLFNWGLFGWVNYSGFTQTNYTELTELYNEYKGKGNLELFPGDF